MLGEHAYAVDVEWTGAREGGTTGYRAYGRDHVLQAAAKSHVIEGSSDRVFHGDAERWNPEELLLGALSQCHLLSYLHVATLHGVVVVGYTDSATGTMVEDGRGGGAFREVVLRPRVVVRDPAMVALAQEIHAEAAAKCFIAASVAFPVRHEPVAVAAG
ncbi:OsmC family protein [Agromyces salentinus]|uniref:OsmC family protein n=1 Tax=Agromyces salentinus TaxID=269421 RepID=A0ABN2MWK5_9MICO|nr:OsmC family protein [Agromyces salentinus]